MVGHASFHTARGMGPSTMERSNDLGARVGVDIREVGWGSGSPVEPNA